MSALCAWGGSCNRSSRFLSRWSRNGLNRRNTSTAVSGFHAEWFVIVGNLNITSIVEVQVPAHAATTYSELIRPLRYQFVSTRLAEKAEEHDNNFLHTRTPRACWFPRPTTFPRRGENSSNISVFKLSQLLIWCAGLFFRKYGLVLGFWYDFAPTPILITYYYNRSRGNRNVGTRLPNYRSLFLPTQASKLKAARDINDMTDRIYLQSTALRLRLEGRNRNHSRRRWPGHPFSASVIRMDRFWGCVAFCFRDGWDCLVGRN